LKYPSLGDSVMPITQSGRTDPEWQIKSGAAALATCIVRTLNESDPTFQTRFLENLDRAYSQFREGDRNPDRDTIIVLEMLSWPRELLTGWNMIAGQGEPLLD
jgi:hypothetical protein